MHFATDTIPTMRIPLLLHPVQGALNANSATRRAAAYGLAREVSFYNNRVSVSSIVKVRVGVDVAPVPLTLAAKLSSKCRKLRQ